MPPKINPVDPSCRTSVSWRTFLSVDPFQSNGTLVKRIGEKKYQQYQHDRISQHSWCPSISVHKPRWPASDFDPGSSLGLIDQLRPLLCSLGARSQSNPAGTVAASHRNQSEKRDGKDSADSFVTQVYHRSF